jgi:hypothetical protein
LKINHRPRIINPQSLFLAMEIAGQTPRQPLPSYAAAMTTKRVSISADYI